MDEDEWVVVLTADAPDRFLHGLEGADPALEGSPAGRFDPTKAGYTLLCRSVGDGPGGLLRLELSAQHLRPVTVLLQPRYVAFALNRPRERSAGFAPPP